MKRCAGFVLAMMWIASGCGDDTETFEGQDGGVLDCTGKTDGLECGGPVTIDTDASIGADSAVDQDAGVELDGGSASVLRRICFEQRCLPSKCGDGYTDTTRGEECDDGNTFPFDGCEPDVCKHTCNADTDCNDGNLCNGQETCYLPLHICREGLPADNGAGCPRDPETPTTLDGICRGGSCAPTLCGNGATNSPSEECDDENLIDQDGCNNDCQFSCDEDVDCSDANICNGEESCVENALGRVCRAGTSLNCDDQNSCTVDDCNPSATSPDVACEHSAGTDVDMDGHSPTSSQCPNGDDCNDNDPAIFGGATEYCDTKDNDCDGKTDLEDDDVITDTVCYKDADGDRFGDESTAMSVCGCPEGWVLPVNGPDGKPIFDCNDSPTNGKDVHPRPPNHNEWFDAPYGYACGGFLCLPLWDYDCSRTVEVEWDNTNVDRCAGTLLCTAPGWVGPDVPPCGSGDYQFQSCQYNSALRRCLGSQNLRVQRCH